MKRLKFSTIAAALSLVMVLLASLGATAQAQPQAAAMIDALDSFQQVTPGQGWVVFNGRLYWTDDDGAAWADVTPASSAQIAAVNFLDADHGWAVLASSGGFSLASSADGGRTWQSSDLLLPALTHTDAPVTRVFMEWQSTTEGWLSFKLATSSNFDRRIGFVTRDAGVTWTESAVGGPIGPAGSDPPHVTEEAGAGLVDVSMSTASSGWARRQSGQCADGVCEREVALVSLGTGSAWTAIPLPNGQTALREQYALAADSDTKPYVGQGFDKCEIASLSQMQTWWNASPYSAVNLYFGGISRACSNTAITPAFLAQLRAQGWRFMPTWVGLQASCTGYNHRMSSDPAVSYVQGKQEADAAVAAAQALGLTNADGSGTVIYFDLEAYNTGNTQCRAAANAFINGWSERLQATGNLAGVYGASCGSAPSDWASLAHVPDALWVANWYDNAGAVSYTPTATVWNAACLSNALWPNHQRLRQYAGDHTETWGGVSFSIDSNVLDGPLTVTNGTGDVAAPSAPSNPVPANAGTLDRTADTWLRWKTNGDTCSLHIWGGELDTTVATNCSTYHLGPLGPGAYSWQVTAMNGFGSTLGPVWSFGIPPNPPTNLNASPVNYSRINLIWTPSTDEPNVDGYAIYVDDAQVATTSAGTGSYQVQNLACRSTHSFMVKTIKQGIQSGASNTASATTASCAPVLTSPLGGSTVDSLRPSFAWEPISGTSYYQIQIAAGSNFSTLTVNTRVTSSAYTPSVSLLVNKLYSWRVRAIGSFGTGDWATSTFITPNPPPVPGLLTPAKNSLTYDTSITFDWKDVTPPAGTNLDHYQIQVATAATFAAPVMDENVVASTLTPSFVFEPNTKYFWRVRAVNTLGHAGNWSPAWAVRRAILPPELVSPANGATLLTRRPAFDWSDVDGASGYTVEIAKVDSFATVIRTISVTKSSLALTSDLPANSTLFWRVRASGANGPSQWSPVWNFVTPNPPSRPALRSPLNGSVISDLTPLLTWQVVSVPAGTTFDHYQVQVSSELNFASPIMDQAVATLSPAQYTLVTVLQPGKRYFWRVMACNSDGACSAWSAVWQFKTSLIAKAR